MEPPSVSPSSLKRLKGFAALADSVASEAATSPNHTQNSVSVKNFDGREREGREVCHT
jgi:hypothetical protein